MVVGNIFAPRLSLLEGARLNAKIDMNAAEAASGRDRNDTAQADARQKVASGGK